MSLRVRSCLVAVVVGCLRSRRITVNAIAAGMGRRTLFIDNNVNSK